MSDYTATDPLNITYQILLASVIGTALFFYLSTSLNRPIVATAIFSYVDMPAHFKISITFFVRDRIQLRFWDGFEPNSPSSVSHPFDFLGLIAV